MIFPLFLCAAYLVGSIPFGLLLTKYATGLDIRKIGSGNIGATNVLRSGNKILALWTLFLDGFKGVFILILYRLINPTSVSFQNELLIAGAAILGHLFPIFLKFKGGKGIATGAGCLLYLSPHCGLITALIWGLTFISTRQSSLAALVATLLMPIITYLISGIPFMIWSLAVGGFIIYKHKNNISRLRAGTELTLDPFAAEKD